MEKLLKSRKFMLSLVVILVQLLLIAVPDTRPYADAIGKILFAVLGVAVLGITVEDSMQAFAARPVNTEAAVRSIIDEALSTIFAPVTAPGTETQPLTFNIDASKTPDGTKG